MIWLQRYSSSHQHGCVERGEDRGRQGVWGGAGVLTPPSALCSSTVVLTPPSALCSSTVVQQYSQPFLYCCLNVLNDSSNQLKRTHLHYEVEKKTLFNCLSTSHFPFSRLVTRSCEEGRWSLAARPPGALLNNLKTCTTHTNHKYLFNLLANQYYTLTTSIFSQDPMG